MNSTNAAISVIVPCYNVEKYLDKCLISLENQTFKNFEVLLIDDVSQDSSTEIAKRYAEKNDNFTYYLIEKGGLGGARNFGIKQSKGKYLAFLDSDDFYSPYYLEKMYKAAVENDADMVCCSYKKYYENTGKKYTLKIRRHKDAIYDSTVMKKKLLNDWTVRSYAWNKLCKKSLFTKNCILYPRMFFEDIATSFRLAHHAEKIVAIDEDLYYYTMRENSIMSSINVEKLNDYSKAFAICIDFLDKNGGTKGYKFNIANMSKSVMFGNLYMIFKTHFKKRIFKGMFKNFAANIKTVYFILRHSQKVMLDDKVIIPYKIKDPEEFINTKNKAIEISLQTSKKSKKEKLKEVFKFSE